MILKLNKKEDVCLETIIKDYPNYTISTEGVVKNNKNKLSYCPYKVDEELLKKVAFSLWKD